MEENMELISQATVVLEKTPEMLAREINEIKTETFRFLESAFAHANRSSREIGRLLIQAKELVEPGRWIGWLRENVDYSEDTAQNMMRIYREYDVEKVPEFQQLNYSQMVALFPLPPAERAELVVEAAEEKDLSKLSVKEVKALVKQRDDALKKLKAADERNEKRAGIELDLRKARAELSEQRQKADACTKEIETQKRKFDSLQKKYDDLEAHPKVVEKKVNEPTAEKLKELEDEAKKAARAELENELQERLDERMQAFFKENEKQEAMQDSRVVEINVMLTQIKSLIDLVFGNMDMIRADDAKLAKKMVDKLQVFFDRAFSDYGFEVKKKEAEK